MITETGRLYGLQDIEEACYFIEDLFGKDFFKKGIEQLKDSDPSGAGMGREYCGSGASKLLLAWHRVREELAFGMMEEYYRPGGYGALLGSLCDDLKVLSCLPGAGGAAAGLLEDKSFESTVLLLFLASKFFSSGRSIAFSGEAPNSFYCQNCLYTSISLPDGSLTEPDLKKILRRNKNISPASPLGQVILAELPDSECIHSFSGTFAADSLFQENPGLHALYICKTQFPSGSSGCRREISFLPLVNKKTSGTLCTEGLLPGITL